MPKLTIFKGLPGSGKSTMATDLLCKNSNTIRVNRDNLRKMLHGDVKWSPTREKLTVEAEKSIVCSALLTGTSVVIDDTNILGQGTSLWTNVALEIGKLTGKTVPTDIVDLTTRVSIMECIRRDGLRHEPNCVGRGVIERMALQGQLIDLSIYDKIAIVDIDGTLADLTHRLHYLQETPKNHEEFFHDAVMDSPIESIWKAVRILKASGHCVIILSGRPANTGNDTESWLLAEQYMTESLEPLPFDHLLMRQTGDHKPDDQVKRQLFEMMLKAGLKIESIKVVIDDRESVCALWREFKLPLIQVEAGCVVQMQPDTVQIAIDCGIPVKGIDPCK